MVPEFHTQRLGHGEVTSIMVRLGQVANKITCYKHTPSLTEFTSSRADLNTQLVKKEVSKKNLT